MQKLVSYATIIRMAIESSQTNQMTLSEIYQWIRNRFKYFRDDPNQGWQVIIYFLSLATSN